MIILIRQVKMRPRQSSSGKARFANYSGEGLRNILSLMQISARGFAVW